MKHAIVTWIDAEIDLDQKSKEEWMNDDLAICVTIGHVVSENEKCIKIALDYFADSKQQYRCVETIPRGMIVSITYE